PSIHQRAEASALELRDDGDRLALAAAARLPDAIADDLERVVPADGLERVAVAALRPAEAVGVVERLHRRLAAAAQRPLVHRMLGVPLGLHDAAVPVLREQ